MANINLHSSTSHIKSNNIKVNYVNRDFYSVRTDLVNYLKAFFPEQWQDFNVASPGMALVELNAYVADLLSYTIDKKYNELFIDGVKQRDSVYRMAKTFGYEVPGTRASTTIADITIELPVTADGPDYSYSPVIRQGMQIKGGGQIFETVDEIDFASDFSERGTANRIIEPILNANEDLIKYRITKRELIKAGVTRYFKMEVLPGEEEAFMKVILPENNVLEIVGVVVKNGVGITKMPTYSEFEDINYKFWEVDYLSTDKVYIEDDLATSSSDIKIGKYITITKRFTKEFLSDGRCMLTFGGGQAGYDPYDDYIAGLTNSNGCYQVTDLSVSNLLNGNSALGEMVQGNSTIFVKYRIGGGVLSNIGSYVLQSVGNIEAIIGGADESVSQSVISSIRANNPIPAYGGRGLPSVEEIKKYISANFAAQKRCVTLEDYVSRAYQLPGKFGSPFRIYGMVDDNKIILYVLTLDQYGKINTTSSSEIKQNIVTYLAPYKMINDFVEINDGKVINLGVEVDLLSDKSFNSNDIKKIAIETIRDFMDINKWHMNQTIYISQIVDELRDIPGVINVVDVRFYNLERGAYSMTVSSQATGARTYDARTDSYSTEIEYVDNAIKGTPLSMFEIKYPEKDIKVRMATGNDQLVS